METGVGLHSAGKARAECARGKLQREAARRMLERKLVSESLASSPTHRRVEKGIYTARPHSSLGYKTPEAFRESFAPSPRMLKMPQILAPIKATLRAPAAALTGAAVCQPKTKSEAKEKNELHEKGRTWRQNKSSTPPSSGQRHLKNREFQGGAGT